MNAWYENTVIYHIYPIGFCGAPKVNNGGEVEYRLDKLTEWIPHLKELGIGAVYLGPIFESAEHGYDTTDYYTVDRRLGDNASFKKICTALHDAGIRIVLDGVFNHVGRNFAPFVDIQHNGGNSKYCGWFNNLHIGGRSPYGDNFSYDGWNGHYNLVKLNLKNPEVCDYLLGAVKLWIEEFGIDGIRFDAADCIEPDFFKRVRSFTKGLRSDFWLMGEIIHGDYNRWANPEMLDSVTNYECYKGIWSSHNDSNLFEINYSINRQSGNGGIYKNIQLYNFVDNHDVNRLASTLRSPEHLFNCYTLLYSMPGLPSIYYGSEYGIAGKKENNSDDNLRPELNIKTIGAEGAQGSNQRLFRHLCKLGSIRKRYSTLAGSCNFTTLVIKNKELLVRRDGEVPVFTAINIEDFDSTFEFDAPCPLTDVLGNLAVSFSGGKARVTVPRGGGAVLVPSDKVVADTPETTAIPPVTASPETTDVPATAIKKPEIKHAIAIATHTVTGEKLEVYSDDNGNIFAKPIE